MRSAEELIDYIVNTSQVSSRKRRQDIQRELRAHIEDFVIAAHAAGCDRGEIEKLVLAHFGDPGEIAQGFAWVYRGERRRLEILAYALSTLLLTGFLLAVILTMQTGLALGFGTPIIHVFASRHTLVETFDILASVAAYLGVTSLENVFRSHRFQKAGFLLTLIDSILIVSFAVAGFHITFLLFGLMNGLFSRAVQVFVTRKVARAGIVVVCFRWPDSLWLCCDHRFLRLPSRRLAPVG